MSYEMPISTFFSHFEGRLRHVVALLLQLVLAMPLAAQTPLPPSATPQMTVVTADGQSAQETSYDGGAPLQATFEARVTNVGNYTPLYEWQFLRENNTTPFLTRYDATTSFDFVESGSFRVRLLISFVQGNDTVSFAQDEPFLINIAESKLEFPNAFTPNGDGVNDVFRAKEGYQSIVSMEATVVNRWGKRMAHWTSPADGWDGRLGGNDAPEGAYFLNVTARGADGRNYRIKKTINLLRRYDASTR